jgi:ribosome-binding ATPase YchF (GTP1/OBG family)
VGKFAQAEGAQAIPVCAKIEAELAELKPEEQAAFLKDLGLKEAGLDRLIRAGYKLLGLQSFYTAGEDECRAWTILQGTLAPQAAGTIHSDIEKGFIRAEVMAFEELRAKGSEKAMREAGLLRLEGKDYAMKDGDVVYFRFNV